MAKNRTKIRYQHISCYPSAAASFLRLCGHFFVPKIYALCFVSPSCSRTLGRVDRHNTGYARIPSFEVSLVNGMLMFFSRQCSHPRNKIFWHFFFGTMMCTTFHRNAYLQYQRPVQSSRHHMLTRFATHPRTQYSIDPLTAAISVQFDIVPLLVLVSSFFFCSRRSPCASLPIVVCLRQSDRANVRTMISTNEKVDCCSYLFTFLPPSWAVFRLDSRWFHNIEKSWDDGGWMPMLHAGGLVFGGKNKSNVSEADRSGLTRGPPFSLVDLY